MTDTTNRSKKFLKSIGIYAIGNIGSKLITFLMIPLYTFFVDTAEFGYYDLCLSAVLLLATASSLQLRDGAFRFLVDCRTDSDRTAVISLSLKILSKSLLVFLLLAIATSFIHPVRCLWLSFALMLSIVLLEIVGQMARGIGETKTFVASNIISALFVGIFSVIFVALFHWGITGIFLANILARVTAILFIELRTRLLRRHFSPRFVNRQLTKEILRYTLPILPGVMCWWFMQNSDRFFIQHYLSLSDNGIYAVTVRFTTVLQIIGTIIFQAWQETALQQYNSPDRDKFFSEIFNSYIKFMAPLIVAFGFGLRFAYPWLVNENYQSGHVFLFPLAFGAALFSMAQFLEMGYQCAKETGRAIPAITLAAVTDLVLNFLLIGRYGLYGVVAAAVTAYIVLLVYRIIDSRRYMKLKLEHSSMVAIMLTMAGFAVFYLTNSPITDFLITVLSLVLIVTWAPESLRHKLGLCRKA